MNIDLVISDVDETLLNSYDAVRVAQAKAISRESILDYDQAVESLKSLGLEKTIDTYLGMELDSFFKGPYKTFDPVLAAQDGTMRLYDDVARFLEGNVPVVAISNSSQKASEEKMAALGISDLFVGIHAEFEKGKAKPNLYLAEKAFSDLDEAGLYNPNDQIVVIGDREYDIQFGHNIKSIHPNTVSVLMDRGKEYSGVKADAVVNSFMDLYNLWGK